MWSKKPKQSEGIKLLNKKTEETKKAVVKVYEALDQRDEQLVHALGTADELEQQANEFQKVTAIKVKQIKSENKKIKITLILVITIIVLVLILISGGILCFFFCGFQSNS